MSMDAICDPAPRQTCGRIMLVMLPGAKGQPVELMQYGFVRALRERSLAVDVVAVEAHMGYLGYGTEDRFAAASKILAECLPAAQVVAVAGGHDWATWVRLWRQLLDRDLFLQKKPLVRALPSRKR